MKIVSKGRVLNSSEFYKKKQKRRRIQLVFVSISFILLISSFIYLSRHEQLQIVEIIVLGEEVVGKEEIVSTVKELLTGHYLRTVPKANAFLYPRQVIRENLFKEFPRFKSVDLDVNNFHTLSIDVEERAPFALYCANKSECYFLDEDGLIFALAPSFSGAIYFIYTTEKAIEKPLGERLISIEEFRQLLKFMETLATLNIYPSGLELGKDEYKLLLPTGGEIIWRRESDLTFIRSNLEAFLSDDSIQAQKNFLDKVVYLDLRVDDKVFYRIKD
jgi:hypothetical protein